jgi:hypothetical protein
MEEVVVTDQEIARCDCIAPKGATAPVSIALSGIYRKYLEARTGAACEPR